MTEEEAIVGLVWKEAWKCSDCENLIRLLVEERASNLRFGWKGTDWNEALETTRKLACSQFGIPWNEFKR